jgi:hypothetical protein
MTYVTLDDNWDEHPKFVGLSEGAQLLFVKGLTYANRFLTDGHIPKQIAHKKVHKGSGKAKELCAAGIFQVVKDGYLIRDFLDWNDSKEVVLERRRKSAERVAKARIKIAAEATESKLSRSQAEVEPNLGRFQSPQRILSNDSASDHPPVGESQTYDECNAVTNAVRTPCVTPLVTAPSPLLSLTQTNTACLVSPPPPAPSKSTEPDKPKRTRKATAKTPLPPDWQPTPAHAELGKSLGFDATRLSLEVEKFRDRNTSKGELYADWNAAFRNWLRNALSFDELNRQRVGVVSIRGNGGRILQPAIEDWVNDFAPAVVKSL